MNDGFDGLISAVGDQTAQMAPAAPDAGGAPVACGIV